MAWIEPPVKSLALAGALLSVPPPQIAAGFSLEAMEHVLAESRAAAAPGADEGELKKRLSTAEQEVGNLKTQLECSEKLRKQGQQLLCDLKREFEVLERMMLESA